MNNLTRLLELVNSESALSADEVNAEFAAPFSGMTEMYALSKGLEIGYETANTRAKVLGEIIQKLIKQRDCLIHNSTYTHDGEKEQIRLCNDELIEIAARYFEGEG